jgi:hypothetical protein
MISRRIGNRFVLPDMVQGCRSKNSSSVKQRAALLFLFWHYSGLTPHLPI